MTVDFHVHSTASDGTFPPAEIVAKARGFSAIALTDHDNCDGLAEFLSAPVGAASSPRQPLLRVTGIELSIDPGAGFDRFHLLGLGIDPANAALKAFLRRVLDGRNARNERILANFARLGIEIPSGEIARYAHGDVLARPHFANWLVDHRYAADKAEAFAKYLADDSPRATSCYEERWHPSQEEAFAVIHGAGGLCVMAHPRYWKSDWKRIGCDFPLAERELARLREAGLDGVEALYQANTPEENVEFARIARKLGFLVSAGSDFHGANKKEISLGMEVADDFIKPILERLRLRSSCGLTSTSSFPPPNRDLTSTSSFPPPNRDLTSTSSFPPPNRDLTSTSSFSVPDRDLTSTVYVLNGWAAEDSIWDGCSFPRARIFSYLEQLDGVQELALADKSDFVLVGFSMGGSSALRLALKYPDRLRGLVLVSATARMMEEPQTDWKGLSLRRRAALKLGTQIAFRDNLSPLFAEPNLDRGLDCLQQTDLRAELRAIPADSRLKRIPVAIFQSERDGIVRPANALFLKEIFPQAALRFIPGAEHSLPPRIPSEIDEAVRRMLGHGDAASCDS